MINSHQYRTYLIDRLNAKPTFHPLRELRSFLVAKALTGTLVKYDPQMGERHRNYSVSIPQFLKRHGVTESLFEHPLLRRSFRADSSLSLQDELFQGLLEIGTLCDEVGFRDLAQPALMRNLKVVQKAPRKFAHLIRTARVARQVFRDLPSDVDAFLNTLSGL